MTPLPFVVMHALVLASGPRGNYQVQIRSEARARSLEAGDVARGNTSADLELNPALRAGLDGGQWQGALAYTPRLLIREPQEDARTALLNRGTLLLEHGAGRRVHTWFSQSGGYGVTQFSLLTTGLNGTGTFGSTSATPNTSPSGSGQTTSTDASGTNSAVQTVPSLTGLRYLESDSRVGLDARLTQRLSMWSAAAWTVSGGASPEARQSLPLQRGPELMVGLDYRATRQDTLKAHAFGNDARFSSGQRASLLTLMGEASHRFTRQTQGSAGVGLSQTWLKTSPTAPAHQDLQPAASASLLHQVPLRGQRLEGGLSAVIAPTVDRFNARVVQRVEVGGSATWGMNKGLALTARATYGQTLTSQNGQGERATLAEAAAAFPLGHHWALDAGVRGGWQRASAATSPTRTNWLSFVAVTFADDGPL